MIIRSIALASLAVVGLSVEVFADTFGTGNHTFEIEFVTIGSPGNAADETLFSSNNGAVDYEYRIGKFEISEQMIDKANALSDLRLTKANRGPNRPASDLSWFEAARFVNWLNTSSGFSPAYKFLETEVVIGRGTVVTEYEFELWEPDDPGFDVSNQFRNSLANYVLPSRDEWYKAAYFNPDSEVYYNFATGSDMAPLAVASGTAPGTAVYKQFGVSAGPADIMLAGGPSPNGTIGQSGNVGELIESEFDGINDNSTFDREFRGGDWGTQSFALSSSGSGGGLGDISFSNAGIRVVGLRIPEPSSLAVLLMFSLSSVSVLRLRN